jgi:hypothetical protein
MFSEPSTSTTKSHSVEPSIVIDGSDKSGPNQPKHHPTSKKSQSQLDSGPRSSFSVTDRNKAEVLWAMKCVHSHYSYNSCTDIKELFINMFPDSNIAQTFTCGERKCSYLCCFGLAPHFKSLVLESVRSSDFHVLLFDESLNKVTKTKQMDIHVRYWSDNEIHTRYYGSVFLGHATANDMLDNFLGYVNLDLSKTLQISMDGPNVNWSFFEKLQNELFKDTDSSLINIGSCGLHVVHGAFKHACKSVDWDIESVLTSAYWLFKDTPARREDYTKATGSSEFAMKFCSVRWLENIPTAERIVKMWDHLKVYLNKVKKNEYPNPKTKSFDNLVKATEDPLFLCKINFYISMAKVVKPFLEKYQTDKPMLPYMAKDMRSMFRDLLSKFLRKDKMPDSNSISELTELNLRDKDNQVNYKKVDIGFSADRILKELIATKKISDRNVLEFRMNCLEQLITLTEKLMLKAPIKHSLVRNLTFLNPHEMVEHPDDCIKRLRRVLASLITAKRIQENKCDDIVNEYKAFLEDKVACNKGLFLEPGRLDTLMYSQMSEPQYRHLFSVTRMLLILSHGQATVERGFSINRQVEQDNMIEKTFIAQRLICDHIDSVGGIFNVNISKSLLLSVAGARQKYDSYMQEQRQIKTSKEKQLKRKNILDVVDELKTKKKRLMKDQECLIKSADDFAEKAETTGKHQFIVKSNSFRRTAKDKAAEIKEVEELLDQKLQSLKEK